MHILMFLHPFDVIEGCDPQPTTRMHGTRVAARDDGRLSEWRPNQVLLMGM